MMDDQLDIVSKEKEPSSVLLVSSLAIAGLLSGIILVFTFINTNPRILANKEAAIQRAIFKVLPNCSKYQTLKLENGQLQESTGESDGQQIKDAQLVYAGFNEKDEFVGFAVPGSEPGFQDMITAIFGYDGHEMIIIGFEVLESKETPGLGDKIFKDIDFQENFQMLAVEPEIVAVKKGQKKNKNEVEAITGATISSKAVVNLLNNTIDIWEKPIADYLNRNDIKSLGSR